MGVIIHRRASSERAGRTVKQDYYSILTRALSAAGPLERQSRLAVYDRARRAMARAPLTLDEITHERLALETAIRRIESEIETPPDEAKGRTREDAGVGIKRASTTSSGRVRRYAVAFVCGCVALALSIAAFVGYRNWSKPIIAESKAVAQAPARNVTRVSQDLALDESRPYTLNRQVVYYRSIHPAGTIIISKSQNFLYLVRPKTSAMRYTIGVGPECVSLVGLLLVSAKEDWGAGGSQDGNDVQLVRNAGGRLGPRSLALSDTGHRIHGNVEPGRVVGCFPLANPDVIDLYERVPMGTRVVMN